MTIHVNVTNFTGPTFQVLHRDQDVGLFFSGSGSLAVESLGEDGVWRAFSDLTFGTPVARALSLPLGTYRVNLTGGPGTIEVRL